MVEGAWGATVVSKGGKQKTKKEVFLIFFNRRVSSIIHLSSSEMLVFSNGIKTEAHMWYQLYEEGKKNTYSK